MNKSFGVFYFPGIVPEYGFVTIPVQVFGADLMIYPENGSFEVGEKPFY